MMRMLRLAFLGLFLWMSSSSVVHARHFDLMNVGWESAILLYACKAGMGQCTYEFDVKENGKVNGYKIPRTDCNSAQSNGYTFTRALDDKSFQAQSPCSGMSIDTLKQGPSSKQLNESGIIWYSFFSIHTVFSNLNALDVGQFPKWDFVTVLHLLQKTKGERIVGMWRRPFLIKRPY
ncbi:hypothetical protein BCR42DRAFT_393268 [Absidia repens]|uniref:Uncharacterized protein n=1 Tax=Absidia repens TaxID=90262 RepID=A0A1X2IFA8_9FUNG|nr:hypothetical protein BCR42DRAFT_393268 [Absidia repens]